MEKYFKLRNMSNETKAVWPAYQLTGEVATWWDNEKYDKGKGISPTEFTENKASLTILNKEMKENKECLYEHIPFELIVVEEHLGFLMNFQILE